MMMTLRIRKSRSHSFCGCPLLKRKTSLIWPYYWNTNPNFVISVSVFIKAQKWRCRSCHGCLRRRARRGCQVNADYAYWVTMRWKSKWFQDHLSLSTIIPVSLIRFTKSDLSLVSEKGVQQDEPSQIFLLSVECRTPKID